MTSTPRWKNSWTATPRSSRRSDPTPAPPPDRSSRPSAGERRRRRAMPSHLSPHTVPPKPATRDAAPSNTPPPVPSAPKSNPAVREGRRLLPTPLPHRRGPPSPRGSGGVCPPLRVLGGVHAPIAAHPTRPAPRRVESPPHPQPEQANGPERGIHAVGATQTPRPHRKPAPHRGARSLPQRV